MSGAYPHFKSCYTHEQLVEHFLLTPADLQLVFTCRGDANRCGMTLLLKALVYLGYVPEKLNSIPGEVRSFIAGQLVYFGISASNIHGIVERGISTYF